MVHQLSGYPNYDVIWQSRYLVSGQICRSTYPDSPTIIHIQLITQACISLTVIAVAGHSSALRCEDDNVSVFSAIFYKAQIQFSAGSVLIQTQQGTSWFRYLRVLSHIIIPSQSIKLKVQNINRNSSMTKHACLAKPALALRFATNRAVELHSHEGISSQLI